MKSCVKDTVPNALYFKKNLRLFSEHYRLSLGINVTKVTKVLGLILGDIQDKTSIQPPICFSISLCNI